MSYFDIEKLRQEAKQTAVEKAKALLDTPESLDKVSELHAAISKQNEIINNQLKTITASQIEEAKLATQLLYRSDSIRSLLQEYFKNTNALGKDSQLLFDNNYKLIRKTLITVRNVKRVRDGLAKLLVLKKEIEEIDDILDDSSPNYVEAHEKLVQLENIRDAALKESIENEYIMEIFKEYFEDINHISDKFKSEIFGVIERVGVVALSEEDPALLVQIVRIVEKEEERDASIMRELQKEELAEIESSEAQSKSNTLLPPKIKRRRHSLKKMGVRLKKYREHLMQLISKMIKEAMEYELINEAPLENKLNEISTLMRDDLEKVKTSVIPCFPDEYRIEEFFQQEYEKELSIIVDALVEDFKNMSNEDALLLIYWLRNYPIIMQEVIENPKNFEDQVHKLCTDYAANRSEFMLEVTKNAILQDFGDDVEPQPTEDGYPYTPAIVEIFTMLNSQLDEVSKAKMDDLTVMVINASRSVLQMYSKMMLSEIEKRLSTISLLHFSAYINNINISLKLLEVWEERIFEIISYKENKLIVLEGIRESFQEMAEKCLNLFVDILAKDDVVDSKMKELFTNKWYESGDQIKIIVKLFEKYLENIHLEENFMELFVERLLKKTINQYLEQLLGKQNNLRLSAPKQILSEIIEMKNFFQMFWKKNSEESIDEYFGQLESIQEILEKTSMEDFIIAFKEMCFKCPNPWPLAMACVQSCAYLDKNLRKKFLDYIQEDFEQNLAKNKNTELRCTFSDYQIVKQQLMILEKIMKNTKQQIEQKKPMKEEPKVNTNKEEQEIEITETQDLSSIIGETLDVGKLLQESDNDEEDDE